jgi:hypothetical protein
MKRMTRNQSGKDDNRQKTYVAFLPVAERGSAEQGSAELCLVEQSSV